MRETNFFILAAGLGERLRPLTKHIPKPLMPVTGKPVLEHVLEKAATLSVGKIGINLHFKAEAVVEWINQSSWKDKTILFPEDPVLGTGGALKNAEDLLKEGTFIVHNSDILSDMSLEVLIEHHCASGNIATLAVHDYPRFNSLVIDDKQFFQNIEQHTYASFKKGRGGAGRLTGRRFAFTGVAVYEAYFLDILPEGKSSVVDAWLSAVKAGYKIGTFNVSGCYWSDIGTPVSYASAVFDALKNNGETVFVHPTVKTCFNIDLQGNVVIEKNCILHQGISLKNCILLPGSRIPERAEITGELATRKGKDGKLTIENCIVGPDFKVNIRESETLCFDKDGRRLVGTGGSDRKYYRVKQDGESVILMQSYKDDPDFERYIEYSKFFHHHSIPVPSLIRIDKEKAQITLEDAGDISLYSHLKCPREICEVIDIYRKVMDALVILHTKATEYASECPFLQDRVFDYAHSRWETGYFIKRFIKGLMNMRLNNVSLLEKEFHQLASKVESFPGTVIHRDFQSQNVMVLKGGEIKIIDFQGARIGPPAYDVASVLWDPYYRLDDSARAYLKQYYIDAIIKVRGEQFEEKLFGDSLITCRLQRHMQALGAYGFLSEIKGKKYFLKYVAEGVRLLKEDIGEAEYIYPELKKLIMRL